MLERFLQLMPAIHSVVIFLTGEQDLLRFVVCVGACMPVDTPAIHSVWSSSSQVSGGAVQSA